MSDRRLLLLLLLVCAACGRGPGERECGAASGLVAATTTDWSVGALATVDGGSGELSDKIASVGGDPLVRWSEGALFQVNRQNGDTIRRYTPGALCRPDWEVALEPGANAHDVEVVGTELWVAQYGRDAISVLDAGTGEPLGAIPLGELADADGLPELHDLVRIGERVFASAQRFERGDPWVALDGVVAELGSDGGVVASWSVGPSPRIVPGPNGQLLLLTGTYGAPDGGLARLDPDSGAIEPLLTEDEAGLDLEGAMVSGAVAVVHGAPFDLGEADGEGTAAVLCVDLDGGGWTVGPREAGWFVDVAGDANLAWVAVRSGWGAAARPGLLPVDPTACEVAGARVETALEPYSLTFVHQR